jgi:hypothetical protein
LTVNDRFAISLRLARSWRGQGKEVIWTVNRRISLPEGYIIAIRLDDGNKSVLDYILLTTGEITGIKIRFMEAGLPRFSGRRFGTSAQLAKAILNQIVLRAPARRTVVSSNRAYAATSKRTKGTQPKGRSKRRTCRGQR